jgi:hypothetical protein
MNLVEDGSDTLGLVKAWGNGMSMEEFVGGELSRADAVVYSRSSRAVSPNDI